MNKYNFYTELEKKLDTADDCADDEGEVVFDSTWPVDDEDSEPDECPKCPETAALPTVEEVDELDGDGEEEETPVAGAGYDVEEDREEESPRKNSFFQPCLPPVLLRPLSPREVMANAPYCSAQAVPEKYILEFGAAPSTMPIPPQVTNSVRRYAPPKAYQPAEKNLIPLAYDTSFSEQFSQIIGRDNVVNIQGIDDDALVFAFFEALVERKAQAAYRNPDSQRLKWLNNHRIGQYQSVIINDYNPLRWRIGNTQRSGTSFVDLFQMVFNVNRRDAVATLAAEVGISTENLLEISKITHVAQQHYQVRVEQDIPHEIALQYAGKNTVARLEQLVEICGYADQVVAAVVQYRFDGDGISFCLPATVSDGVLGLGRVKPSSHFIDESEIDANSGVTVILCGDVRAAIKLREIVKESRKLGNAEVIVTGHMGRNLAPLPWNCLMGHCVAFVPAPSKTSFAHVKEYHEKILEAKARSFTVYPGLLLHSDDGASKSKGDFVLPTDKAETELVEKALYLDQAESAARLVRHIQQSSLSYDAFVDWGRNIGLFRSGEKASAGSEASPIFRPSQLGASLPTVAENVALSDIFPTGTTSTIYGPRDCGKSLFVLGLLRSWLAGTGAYGFKNGEKCPCLLLDSETPPVYFQTRLEQFGLIENGEPLDAFYPISLQGLTDVHPWRGFNLMADGSQKMLLDFCMSNGIKRIVFDNLTSLCRSGAVYQPREIGGLFDGWLKECNQKGVSALLVHHAGESQNTGKPLVKMRGSGELGIRSFTEIFLRGQREILNQECQNSAARRYASEPGATVEARFVKAKGAPVLQIAPIFLHLPQGASTWRRIIDAAGVPEVVQTQAVEAAGATSETGVEASISSESEAADVFASTPDDAVVAPGLKDALREVLDFIKTKGKASRADVEKAFRKGESWASKKLKPLCDCGLLKMSRDGKTVVYWPSNVTS
ncbi:MAG: AAA family ATPase [Desulfovibrio sp.]|jgi:hypothetical protein|nr:AAA family ATPase [Desulfovibrio sp.]